MLNIKPVLHFVLAKYLFNDLYYALLIYQKIDLKVPQTKHNKNYYQAKKAIK